MLYAGSGLKALFCPGDPLGLNAQTTFTLVEFELKAGQQLLMYSDGLLENKAKTGNYLRHSTLRNLVSTSESSADLITALRQVVASFESSKDRDDAACLALRWIGKDEGQQAA